MKRAMHRILHGWRLRALIVALGTLLGACRKPVLSPAEAGRLIRERGGRDRALARTATLYLLPVGEINECDDEHVSFWIPLANSSENLRGFAGCRRLREEMAPADRNNPAVRFVDALAPTDIVHGTFREDCDEGWRPQEGVCCGRTSARYQGDFDEQLVSCGGGRLRLKLAERSGVEVLRVVPGEGRTATATYRYTWNANPRVQGLRAALGNLVTEPRVERDDGRYVAFDMAATMTAHFAHDGTRWKLAEGGAP